ncbi:MAG TPA: DUF4395 domain-containing protein [Nocardioides sp.]|uniref:DUF4395 domain-containing protein n=1 Tax=Nocardioides sp. TaxID=35761 RepID=UPI002F3F4FAC
MSATTVTSPAYSGIDPRGPRVAASLTSVVLALVLVTPTPVAAVLLAVQAVVFGIGAVRGVQHTPYAVLFRTAVRPRLAPPAELEDPRPPRFAQAVGLAFTGVAFVLLLAGATVAALVAVGLALVAALLNAVLGLCLGCELYLILRRATTR